MKFANADCEKVAIENPVGVMNTVYRKPDQIIEPYQFAESVDDKENYVTKRTYVKSGKEGNKNEI